MIPHNSRKFKNSTTTWNYFNNVSKSFVFTFVGKLQSESRVNIDSRANKKCKNNFKGVFKRLPHKDWACLPSFMHCRHPKQQLEELLNLFRLQHQRWNHWLENVLLVSRFSSEATSNPPWKLVSLPSNVGRLLNFLHDIFVLLLLRWLLRFEIYRQLVVERIFFQLSWWRLSAANFTPHLYQLDAIIKVHWTCLVINVILPVKLDVRIRTLTWTKIRSNFLVWVPIKVFHIFKASHYKKKKTKTFDSRKKFFLIN